MLREGSNESSSETVWNSGEGLQPDWREVDRELRSLAKQMTILDSQQLHWLREAERVRLWRHLGYVSMLEYLEHVFGHSPKVAGERLRVARKLETLPELAEALDKNELPFSAVRELSRVATPKTERAWRDEARGKCLREIEELVAEHAEGDLPTDQKKPNLRLRRIFFDVLPETEAELLEARRLLAEERGEQLDGNALISAFANAVFSPTSAGESSGQAKFQIRVTKCECGHAWQEGGGKQIAIDDAALARALCDAQYIGVTEAGKPTRLMQPIPPATRRLAEHRDGGRCCVPGCRSSRYLELHHIIHLEDGGTHDLQNLVHLCDGHHAAHHRGTLLISGTADNLTVVRLAIEDSADPGGARTERFAAHETNRCAVGEHARLESADLGSASDGDAGVEQAGQTPNPHVGIRAAGIEHTGIEHTGVESAGQTPNPHVGIRAAGIEHTRIEPAGQTPSPHVEIRAAGIEHTRIGPAGQTQNPHVGIRASGIEHTGVEHAGQTPNPHVGIRPSRRSKFAEAEARTMARIALKQLGWKAGVAHAAVDCALDELAGNLSLESVIRLALQRCVG